MKNIVLGFLTIGIITLLGCGKGVTDADGNAYTSVEIGTQEWMVENLRTTKYSDGTPIPNITNSDQWKIFNSGAWCHKDNEIKYDSTYGKLYNWYAVETGKLCPTGWHIPTDVEWKIFDDYLLANEHRGVEGTKLKTKSDWNSNRNEIHNNGWNGISGGFRYGDGNFYGNSGYWWSSSEFNIASAWSRNLPSYDGKINRSSLSKSYGFSIRCLKN